MKLSGYITIILLVGLVFASVGSMVDDFEDQYQKNVSTTWATEYDYTEEINKSVSGIKTRFDTIADEEKGWFAKITAGIIAIPLAIIFIPAVMYKTVKYSTEILVGVANQIGIPEFVVYFAVVAIFIVITFAIVSFWHRSKA